MKCNHIWRGFPDWVECDKCGKKLTVDEYIALVNTPEEEKCPKTKKPKSKS